METTPVIITYKHLESKALSKHGNPVWSEWQCIVQETAYRKDGTGYPAVIAIAENHSLKFLKKWARAEGYTAREVPVLDMTRIQAILF